MGIKPTLDDAPLARFHWVLSSLAAMGPFIDGYDLSVVSFQALVISSVFHFSAKSNPLLYGLLLTSALIGMAIGGVSFGWLADRLGRKTMFIVDLLFFIVFTTLSGLAQNIYQVIIFRMLMGIGLGADYPISSALISEFAPTKRRGALLMYGIMFYWLGTLFAGIVNYLTLGLGVGLAWRISFIVGAVIAVPVVAARGVMPESVRWLARNNRLDRANRVAESLSVRVAQTARTVRQSTKDLFSRYWKATLFVLTAWFAFDVGSYGLGFYTATLYREYGINTLSRIALFGVITAPFPILAYLALMAMVDRVGRRKPMLIGLAVMAAVLIVLPGLIVRNPLTLLPLFIIYASMEQWPGGLLSFAYSTELFPTEIRGFAQGLGTTVSRIGAVLGVLLFPLISQSGLVYGTTFFLAFIILAFVLSYLLAPETRQIPLDELSKPSQ
ncbi:MAG: MFS transporter [Thermoprotei archaeon]